MRSGRSLPGVARRVALYLWPVAAAMAMATMAALPARAAEPAAVAFDSQDGTHLKAWLFMPEVQPPRGTVIALHGCGGLYATSGRRQGQLNARHQAVGDMLREEGYAVLYPDSLTPRGVDQICTQKYRSRSIGQAQRRQDTLAARAWVAAQPWADARRIALLGWSHGGSAVLAVTDARKAESGTGVTPAAFAAAVAFYPGCAAALKSGYQPSAPLTMMVGELDDWTPAAPCIALGQAVGAEVHVYPGSYHDFDNPVGTVRLRADVPNGVLPGQGVHAGANPEARRAAYTRLREILRAAFAG
ncbi:MAG: dienelactone hydrolase family protein [Pseudomonadota bacterium]